MIEKLPTVDINEPLGELELTSGYLDPLLFPLFTDYKVKNKLIWPNLVQRESSFGEKDLNS